MIVMEITCFNMENLKFVFLGDILFCVFIVLHLLNQLFAGCDGPKLDSEAQGTHYKCSSGTGQGKNVAV